MFRDEGEHRFRDEAEQFLGRSRIHRSTSPDARPRHSWAAYTGKLVFCAVARDLREVVPGRGRRA